MKFWYHSSSPEEVLELSSTEGPAGDPKISQLPTARHSLLSHSRCQEAHTWQDGHVGYVQTPPGPGVPENMPWEPASSKLGGCSRREVVGFQEGNPPRGLLQ